MQHQTHMEGASLQGVKGTVIITPYAVGWEPEERQEGVGEAVFGRRGFVTRACPSTQCGMVGSDASPATNTPETASKRWVACILHSQVGLAAAPPWARSGLCRTRDARAQHSVDCARSHIARSLRSNLRCTT
jgi:hypothetical protein